jgi:regulatory protein
VAKLPSIPTSVAEAHAAGLAMLSRRELSSVQVRQRLARRGFESDAIDGAIARLQASGALDDRRVALAAARTRVQVKRQGRGRVQRELSAIGVDHAVARDALAEVFDGLDEQVLLEQALEKRLRRGQDPADPAVARRLFGALVRQGFAPGAVQRALRSRRSIDKK